MAYDELDDLEAGKMEETETRDPLYERMPGDLPSDEEADQPAFRAEEGTDSTDITGM